MEERRGGGKVTVTFACIFRPASGQARQKFPGAGRYMSSVRRIKCKIRLIAAVPPNQGLRHCRKGNF